MIKNGTTTSKLWDAKREIIREVYNRLYNEYGPQGWWPLLDVDGTNPTKTGSIKGYHPKDYSYPKTDNQLLEIALGAILTQNTAWFNVEKALQNIRNHCGFNISELKNIDINELKVLIKPAGFYNQKSLYINNFIMFFESLNGKIPTRKEILKVKGIGEESADSILLYGFKVTTFVVDAYTKRIFSYLGIINQNEKYARIKELFEKSIETDLVKYQEYHALIVEHAKRFYSKKPYGINDQLLNDLILASK